MEILTIDYALIEKILTGRDEYRKTALVHKCLANFLGRDDYEELYMRMRPSYEARLRSAISSAFPWVASPKGHQYWRKRDEEWKRLWTGDVRTTKVRLK